MDDSAPITWLINQIHTIVAGGAGGVATTITNLIAPLVAACFGIYVLLITINYMRGAESEPVLDFGLRMVSWSLVIGMGLSASTYTKTVMPMVMGIGPDLADAISEGTAGANSLDQLALYYISILNDGYTTANSFTFPFNLGPLFLYFLKAALVIIGLVPFLVVATLTLIVSNVGLVILAMVGPLFFGFLLFPATRQYFSAWLNSVVSYSLLPLFIAVISLLSVNLSQQMLHNLSDSTFTQVFFASIGNLTLVILVRYIAALASSLSAGGIHIGHVGGIGGVASALRGFGTGTARELRGGYRGLRAGLDAWRNRRGGGGGAMENGPRKRKVG